MRLDRNQNLVCCCESVERENAELREDKARLDWLDKCAEVRATDELNDLVLWTGESYEYTPIRAAIDAARGGHGEEG